MSVHVTGTINLGTILYGAITTLGSYYAYRASKAGKANSAKLDDVHAEVKTAAEGRTSDG